MAPFANAPCNAGNRVIGTWQPQEKNSDAPTVALASFEQPMLTLSGACRFERKTLAASYKLFHSPQHNTAGSYGRAFNIERRQAASDLIGIHELGDS